MPDLFMLRTSASVQRTVQLPRSRSAEITALLLEIRNPYKLLPLFTMFWLISNHFKRRRETIRRKSFHEFSLDVSHVYTQGFGDVSEVHLSSYEEKSAPHSEEPKVIWF